MTEEGSSYHAKYYAENKSKLLAAKKKRYEEDPEYREKIKARAREAKRRQVEERRKEREKNKGKEIPTYFKVMLGDNEISVRMYTAGQLAKRLGRKTQTMRVWERKGIIPEALYRNASKDRLYTELQVRLIVKAYDRAEREFGEVAVSNRIGQTNFSDLVFKIWEEYPLGIEE